jgi:hypothetical protein
MNQRVSDPINKMCSKWIIVLQYLVLKRELLKPEKYVNVEE